MPKVDKRPCYLSAGELAEVLGIGDVEIARLARRGILPRIADQLTTAEREGLLRILKANAKAAILGRKREPV